STVFCSGASPPPRQQYQRISTGPPGGTVARPADGEAAAVDGAALRAAARRARGGRGGGRRRRGARRRGARAWGRRRAAAGARHQGERRDQDAGTERTREHGSSLLLVGLGTHAQTMMA